MLTDYTVKATYGRKWNSANNALHSVVWEPQEVPQQLSRMERSALEKHQQSRVIGAVSLQRRLRNVVIVLICTSLPVGVVSVRRAYSLHNRGCTQEPSAVAQVSCFYKYATGTGAWSPLSPGSAKHRCSRAAHRHYLRDLGPRRAIIPLTFLIWKWSERRVSWISCSVPRGAACTELRNPSSTPLNVNFFIANKREAGPLSEGRSRRPRLHHSRPPRTASRFWRKEGRSLPRYTPPLVRRPPGAAADAATRPSRRRSTKTRRGTASGMYSNAASLTDR